MASKESDKSAAGDDVRRKFREALERKSTKPSETHEGAEGGNKTSAATTNEKAQRMFRRKSGGGS